MSVNGDTVDRLQRYALLSGQRRLAYVELRVVTKELVVDSISQLVDAVVATVQRRRGVSASLTQQH